MYVVLFYVKLIALMGKNDRMHKIRERKESNE